MGDEITFETIDQQPGADVLSQLPYNYLPAALPSLLGMAGAQNRMLIALPDPALGQVASRASMISAADLADPKIAAEKVGELFGPMDASKASRVFLGPPTDAFVDQPLQDVQEIGAVPWATIDNNATKAAVVIIDAGIAFWNARFQGDAGPRFREIRFMDFDTKPDDPLDYGFPVVLNAAKIKLLCNMAEGRGGNRAVMAHLAALCPKSFYGLPGGQDPDALWHGTAVADLAVGWAEGDPETAWPPMASDQPSGHPKGWKAGENFTPDEIALFGIELPMAVLRDSDGDNLTAAMVLALESAVRMSAPFAGPIYVVLPYAFPAGPQDGSHPAAQVISDLLAAYPNVNVIVPSGNHLQDRCHAALSPPDAGTDAHVTWQIPPDDFSLNAVELFVDSNAAVSPITAIKFKPPGAASATAVVLLTHTFCWVLSNGKPLGMIFRFGDLGSRARLRVAMIGTRISASYPVSLPHGDWHISASGPDMVKLWLLRDDRERVLDQALPHRRSWFVDPLYQKADKTGAPRLDDAPGCAVLRSGTVSVIATATAATAFAVQADESYGGQTLQAWYSGRRTGNSEALVDDGRPSFGVAASANGTHRRMRISGSSAATGLYLRRRLGWPRPPAL